MATLTIDMYTLRRSQERNVLSLAQWSRASEELLSNSSGAKTGRERKGWVVDDLRIKRIRHGEDPGIEGFLPINGYRPKGKRIEYMQGEATAVIVLHIQLGRNGLNCSAWAYIGPDFKKSPVPFSNMETTVRNQVVDTCASKEEVGKTSGLLSSGLK